LLFGERSDPAKTAPCPNVKRQVDDQYDKLTAVQYVAIRSDYLLEKEQVQHRHSFTIH